MFEFVNQNVLGFDVSVCDRDHGEIVEASEDLVDVEFGEERCDFFLFDRLVEIIREVVHHDVQILFFSLTCEESLSHLQIVGML